MTYRALAGSGGAGALLLGSLLSAACAPGAPGPGTGGSAQAAETAGSVGTGRHALRGSADGALEVTAPDTVVNRYAVLRSDVHSGDRVLPLTAADGHGVAALMPLAAGDVLLIVQMQGADVQAGDRNAGTFGEVSDYGNAGLFELVTVKSIDMDQDRVEIHGNCRGLRNNYDAAGHTQVVRVPQYSTLNVQSGGSVGAPAWDGASGGVVALLVQGGAQIDGSIDVSGRGFRGGLRTVVTAMRQPGVGTFYASLNLLDGGAKGEGIAGGALDYVSIGGYGRGAIANGGGGGNRIVAGGGGGANGGTIADWNGQGVMPLDVLGGDKAWLLDPGYDATRTALAGGGRGGYTASSGKEDPTLVAPGDAKWMLDSRRERGGLGGRPVPNDAQKRLFFGGGGGAGDDFMDKAGRGGRGGGLLFLVAETIGGSGRLVANGEDGAPGETTLSGGGGGGGGGTALVSATALSGVSIEARGGRGGSQASTGAQAGGPGGGGGGGFIATPAGAQITRSADGGTGGTNASSDLLAFPRNGASNGAGGQVSDGAGGELGTGQACGGADLSMSVTSTPAQDQGQGQGQGQRSFTLRVDIQNRGPSPAAEPSFTLRVPAGGTLAQLQPGPWACTVGAAADQITCTLSTLPAGETSTVLVSLTPSVDVSTVAVTGEIHADSVDPDGSNDTAMLSVQIDGAVLSGGGLGCAVTGGGAARSGAGALFLALGLLGAALWRRRVWVD